MKTIRKRKTFVLVGALALAAVMVLASTFAWFAANDTVKNRLATKDGLADVKIQETFVEPDDWKPNQTITKTVAVADTGSAPALVRLSFKELLKINALLAGDAAPTTAYDVADTTKVPMYHEDLSKSASNEIESILREEHKIKPGTDNDFQVRTQQEMLETMNSISGFLTVLLAAIASISLLVGGIGIMNIMYVTVTERTKEIGLRMSIGAHNRDILLQFLTESIILSLIGGIIGIILGLLLAYAASTLLHWPYVISSMAVIVSFLVCAATGIFFGWYPAKKAANLDPINALRYE